MLSREMDYELVNSETLFQEYFRVDRHRVRIGLFEGGTTEFDREVFERGHAVAVLPYDPVQDKVVLIEQFRIGAHCADRYPWLIEPVAGIVEEGETAEEVAIREAQEEANCSLERLIPMYDYLVSPGACSETVKLYCGICSARDLGGIFGLAEEGENIKVHVVAREQAEQYLHQGKIANAMTIIALQWLMLNRQSLSAL